MLKHPSPKHFRFLLSFGFIVWVAMFIVEYYGFDVNTNDEVTALQWNYHGSKLPYATVDFVYWFGTILYGVGLIGMMFMRGWARVLVMLSIIIDFITTGFMGLLVVTGTMDMLSILVNIVVGVPLVLSFFEPCSRYFQAPKKTV